MESQWLTKSESIVLLGVPEDTFEALVEAGILPEARKVGHRSLKWKRSKIEAVAELLDEVLGVLDRLSRESGPKNSPP